MRIFKMFFNRGQNELKRDNLKMLLRNIRKIALIQLPTESNKKELLQKIELALLENEK